MRTCNIESLTRLALAGQPDVGIHRELRSALIRYAQCRIDETGLAAAYHRWQRAQQDTDSTSAVIQAGVRAARRSSPRAPLIRW